jgi:hypothetical protein
MLLSAQKRMPRVYHSSDDEEYRIRPPLELLVADKVMEKIIAEREYYDKKFAGWKIAFDLMTVAFFVMTIALVAVGYVVYTMPVKIVINVPHAAAGQCPVVDDFMHDFNGFEEPPAGETLETEHKVHQDMFQEAYMLAVSVMKTKNVVASLGVVGPLATCGAIVTAAYLSITGY